MEASRPAPGAARPRRRRRITPIAGVILVAALVGGALLGPALDRHPAGGKDVQAGLGEYGTPRAPSAEYPLGTDTLGRCVVARVLAGARLSLLVALGATALAIALGLAVGLAAGWAGGLADTLLMRLVDLVLSFPALLLVVTLGVALGRAGAGAGAVVLLLGLVGWTPTARVVRARVRALRGEEFVLAARAVGAGPARILGRHVLVNLAGPVGVLATVLVAQMLLAEATLAYLGLGAPPPAPSWGRMLAESQGLLATAPWAALAPGGAILLAAVGFHLLGEGLRAALDPGRGRWR